MCAMERKNIPSRAAANGMRAPERMVPFNEASMLTTMPTETSPAPHMPTARTIVPAAGLGE